MPEHAGDTIQGLALQYIEPKRAGTVADNVWSCENLDRVRTCWVCTRRLVVGEGCPTIMHRAGALGAATPTR
jgi:hypothetical protein